MDIMYDINAIVYLLTTFVTSTIMWRLHKQHEPQSGWLARTGVWLLTAVYCFVVYIMVVHLIWGILYRLRYVPYSVDPLAQMVIGVSGAAALLLTARANYRAAVVLLWLAPTWMFLKVLIGFSYFI